MRCERIHSLLYAAVLAALSGCVSVRETFTGHDPDQVWTAMKAVANAPDYAKGEPADRWTVRENSVWVDEAGNRIEIFRRLERQLYEPGTSPQHQERQWKLRVQLEQREPPTAKFTSRQWGVPAHTWDEASRYFAEVREILGEPNEVQSAPPETSEPAAAQ